jgi:chaperonin GroES
MVSYAQKVELDEEESETKKSDASILEFLDAGNIVDELPDGVAAKILECYNDAKQSMSDWKKKYDKALRLAKLQPKEAKKTFPFEGASTAMAPFVLEAMIDFQARTSPELAYADNIVKAKVYGGQKLPDVPDPSVMGDMGQMQEQAQEAYQQAVQQREAAQERIDTQKEDRASRVAEYSNYQLAELMPAWKQEQDKLLLSLPCVGTMYKKTYFDSDKQEVCSDLCYGDRVVFDQAYPTFESAPDKFEPLPSMSKNEVIERIRGGDEWDIEESELSSDDKETYDFIECHTWVDVDEDGLKEPYCIVIWKDKEKAVYARPSFDEDTITENDDGEISRVEAVTVFTQYQFIPDPEGGPMGMGWGILLGPTFEEINTSIRQMHDAGTLQIIASNSGLIADTNGDATRGNRAQRGPIEMKMGKLTPVQVGGSGNLAQNVVQFPAAGPSQGLFQLLGYMVDSVRRLTDASSQVDAVPGEAAALYLARLQQTLKRPNVITMRVYNCAAKEFGLIFNLNHKHFSDEKYNRIIDEPAEYSMEKDFNSDDCDIRLVADPSQGSDLERIARAETVLQNAKSEQTPVTDIRQATKDYYEILGVADVDALVPEPTGPDPMQALMEEQMKMDQAEKAMNAEFKNREQQLRERDQELKEADQKLKGLKQQLEAFKDMESLGIETDVKEADIVLKYSQAFKNLSEINAGSAAAQARAIEQSFINNPEGGESNGARDAAIPASDTRAGPALGV